MNLENPFSKKKKDKKKMNFENFFKVNIPFSVNICPNDQHQYFGSQDREKKFINKMRESLLILNEIDYYFMIELSEPRSGSKFGPRLHMHGVIMFRTSNTIKQFLMTYYYKLLRIGIIDLDTIDNINIWSKYIHKQRHIMKIKPLTNHLLIYKNDKLESKIPFLLHQYNDYHTETSQEATDKK